MARKRASQSSNTQTETKERITVSALTPETIAELLAGARTKGAGEDVLTDFLASDEVGVEVSLETGPFAGKSAVQAYTGLNNAKKKTKKNDAGETVLAFPEAGSVQVIKRKIGDDERVFLIDKNKVGQ